MKRWMFTKVIAVVLLIALGAGCGGGDRTPGHELVGDLSNRSYYNARGQARVSASGDQVRFEQFEGRFLWADYAAPWCNPCVAQAPAIRQAEASAGEDVVFLTVMTSDMGGFGDPATRATAQKWASQHGLEPTRVVAADLTAITIPRHILYSPEGQMLFIKTGYMSADQIRDVLGERMTDWNTWAETNQLASWMRAN